MKHIGNLEITKENESNFKDLVEVTGYVYVDGSAKLEALQTVGGDLRVDGSAKLEALQTVGGYLIVDGSAKLEALQTVGGDLRVYGSAKLEALQTVGGYLRVDGSAKLEAPALQTVGGYLIVYGSAKLDAPNLKQEKPSQEQISMMQNEPKKRVQSDFERQGYLFADGILQTIISKKTSNGLIIYKTKKIGKEVFNFVIFDGVNYSHGETLEQAKEDLKYKISSRDTTEFKKWELSTVKPIGDMIRAYRSITGACFEGTKQFCESQELKEEYSVDEIIKITSGRYGNKEFQQFFNGVK